MYVNTTARYLGDPMQASGMAAPNPARLAELSKSCATQWEAYKKGKPKNFPHVWRAFLAANPICREGISIRWGYQPSVSPCGDANSGLLIDCWDAALQKGVTLGSLGKALSQAKLDRVSSAYRNMSHAQQVSLRNPRGYYFNGTKMVRNGWNNALTLGQDDDSDFIDPSQLNISTMSIGPSTIDTGLPYSTPIDTSSGVPYSTDVLTNAPEAISTSTGPAPLSAAWWNQVTSPSSSGASVSPFASIAAAFAPLVSAAVAPSGTQVNVGQQGQQQQSPLQTKTLIPGLPNVIVYGGAAFLLLIAVMGNKRR